MNRRMLRRYKRKLARFWLSIEKRLYQRSFGGPYLLCMHLEAMTQLLAKLHERIYGSHIGGRSLAYRVMLQGFWWLNM